MLSGQTYTKDGCADGYRVDPQARIPFRLYASVSDDGVVTITIDSDGVEGHSDADGCPFVRVLINDGEVYNHSAADPHRQVPVVGRGAL